MMIEALIYYVVVEAYHQYLTLVVAGLSLLAVTGFTVAWHISD